MGSRIVVLALLAALAAPPLAGQEAAPGSAGAGDGGSGGLDPVAAWEADPGAVIDGTGVDLGAFEYVARAYVIFADSPRQPQLAEQLRLIEADLRSLALRDVAVIVDADPDARSDLRRDLRPRGFGVVLVDKDGRVVLRRPTPLPVRDIAGAIDRTPLRQEELRQGEPLAPG